MSEILCAHILQKHYESRRPYDTFRQKEINRSPEQALQNIKKIYD